MSSALMRRALDNVDWAARRAVLEVQGQRVVLDPAVLYGAVLVAGPTVVMSPQTWEVLGYNPELVVEVLAQVRGGASGLRFLTMDAGKYGEAARAAAEATGEGAVMAKDAITQAVEDANRLIVNAASLNATPTPLQAQIFAVQLARLNLVVAEIGARLEQLQGLVDLAATAVADVQ